jgi:transposase
MPSAVAVTIVGRGLRMAGAPWIIDEELWGLVEPLLPRRQRRSRYPGRLRLPDREALQGILFVLHSGIAWRHLPPELGFGSGVTCWRRMEEWQRAGVWERLHGLLLDRLRAAGEIDWSRAVADSSQVQAKKGAPRRARARSTAAGPGRSITFSSMPQVSRSPGR